MALKLSSAQMVAAARARIEEIEAEELLTLINDPDVVVVDIRDIRERSKLGFIPNSLHAPRGMIEFWIDPESPYHKAELTDPTKRYVYHCASGWRSALTVATMQDMGIEAAHLKDGFSSWVKIGGQVETNK